MSDAALDHVGFFALDGESAELTLRRLGFTVSPFTVQRNLVHGQLVPAGTGNRLVVLPSGYLEILSPTGEDTELARRFHRAVARYEGVHLVTLSEADAVATRARLDAAGFDPAPIVDLTREVGTETGSATARFEVVRVPAGRMPEGRAQVCVHHTPELVWQQRWMGHANGAAALSDVLFVVADPSEAAHRYAAFAGRDARPAPGGAWQVPLADGALAFVDPDGGVQQSLGAPAPAVPSIAAIGVLTSDIERSRRWLEEVQVTASARRHDVITIDGSDALGCTIELRAPGASSWLDR